MSLAGTGPQRLAVPHSATYWLVPALESSGDRLNTHGYMLYTKDTLELVGTRVSLTPEEAVEAMKQYARQKSTIPASLTRRCCLA